MQSIDGKSLAAKIKIEVKEKIKRLGLTPGLAVILVGDNPASHLYVGLKEKAAREVGIHFEKHTFLGTEPQSEILAKIQELNERFGTSFTEEDRVFIQQLEERLFGDAGLEASVKVNPPDNARLTFDHIVNDKLQEMMDSNFKFYKQITDDREFAKFFFNWLFERYYRQRKIDSK